jgi:cell division septal protein FtsQ
VKDSIMTNDGVRLTPEQKKRQRARSIAIAAVLIGLVVLFYVVTIVKMGPGIITNRPL